MRISIAILLLLLLGVSVAPGQAVINGARTQPEISSGSISNPPANSLTTFVCDDGGTTKLCSKDSAGTVAMGLGGGGGGISSTYDTWANLPGSPSSGDLFKSSNSPYECRYNGASWDCWVSGWDCEIPPTSGWSWVNQGSATVDQTTGMIVLQGPGEGSFSLRSRVRNFPGSTFTVRALISTLGMNTFTSFPGIILRESGTSKIVSYTFADNSSIVGTTWNNDTSLASNYGAFAQVSFFSVKPYVWIELDWQATNRVLSLSWDNFKTKFTFHTIARNDWATTAFDQIGITTTNTNGVPTSINVLCWSE